MLPAVLDGPVAARGAVMRQVEAASNPGAAAMAAAATVGGMVEGAVATPFQAIKTGLQVGPGRPSLATVLRGMPRAAYLRGMTFSVVGTGQRRIFCYTLHNALMAGSPWASARRPAWLDSSVIGATVGLAEAVFSAPAKRAMLVQQSPSHPDVVTPAQAMRHIWAHEGVRGFYRGTAVTAARNGVASGVHLGTLTLLTQPGETSRAEAAWVGAVAGGLSAAASTPWDVVKSRVQDQRGGNQTAWAAAAELLRQDGPRGLFRGLVPNVARSLPAHVAGRMAMAEVFRRTSDAPAA